MFLIFGLSSGFVCYLKTKREDKNLPQIISEDKENILIENKILSNQENKAQIKNKSKKKEKEGEWLLKDKLFGVALGAIIIIGFASGVLPRRS